MRVVLEREQPSLYWRKVIMPIEYREGSLFESGAQVLVNPVNAMGVMGKGVAVVFKEKYPKMFESYQRACQQKQLFAGDVHRYFGEQIIFNAVTKQHWRDPSRLVYVDRCLGGIAKAMSFSDMDSIALPALGCGCGGLTWTEVQPLIEKHLGESRALVLAFFPK